MSLLRPKQTSIVTQGSAAQGSVKSIASQASVARRQEVYKPGQMASSQDMARLQQHVIEATGAVNSLPVLGGVYYPNVAFPAGVGLVFQHGIVDTTAAFLISRVRTVGLYPMVFEVAQARPVPGVTILESFSACTCDVWLYPQPSAQGSKPGVAGTSVPIPPTTPGTPVPSTGWTTLFELDFTAQPNQTLSPDGNYTIAGKSWAKLNSANDTVPMAIVAGTGLVIQPAATSSLIGGATTTQAPLLWISLSALGLTALWAYRFKAFLSIGADNGASASDAAIVGISTLPIPGTGNQLGFFQYRSPITTGTTSMVSTINKTSSTTSSTATGAGKTLMMVPDTLAAYSLQGFTTAVLAAGTAFPAESTFKPAGRNVPAVLDIATSGSLPTDMGLLVAGTRSGSGTPYSVTIQRVRVDYNVS